MTLDIPHMLVTAAIIFAAIWLINHLGAFENMPKAKRSLVLFGVLFVALLILNLVWPYGGGV